ncbi:MAG TPA: tetratricopeptide repeat protein, partial [Chloroflexia bacterium]|nr:tetratricopeptide repeat protein [Chloroflexia bacterium]
LLSAPAREALGSQVPVGTHLLDLGEQQLKDVVRPERVFQLVPKGLASTFPPLRALPAFQHNLPIPLTSFIGRKREMSEAARLLSTTRLLTLVGPGGTGKTRLSLQVATDALEHFPQGVWFVELAPLTEAARLAQAVALALNVHEEPGRPLLPTLIESLGTRRLLMVLDNCEHLLAACSELASAIMSACPEVCILASSREALGIAGETTLRVPSLSLPAQEVLPLEQLAEVEAVRLFLERAGAVRPSFALSEANAPAVATICRRLDGIPLALELAAARVKVLTVEGIAARLDDRFHLLTTGTRTALPRQQTLRALIDWSWDLLSPGEQVLLARLSVFAGGWTLESAEQVAGAPPVDDLLNDLQQLVNKSLVVLTDLDGEVRYTCLETIRQYAREKLAATDEASHVRAQHRAWCVALAEEAEEQLRGPNQAHWRQVLEREHDNLRAALEWDQADPDGGESGLRLAGALWRFWLLHDHWSEGRGWLEAALARAGPPSAARAKALFGLGSLLTDSTAAQALLEQSVALWRRLGDRRGLAFALDGLAEEARLQGNLGQARALAEECLAIFRALDDDRGIASGLYQLGRAAHAQGQFAEARALFAETVRLLRALGDQIALSGALHQWGRTALAAGDYTGARALFEETLALNRALGFTDTTAWLLNSLGEAARYTGDYAQAAQYYAESLALHREVGNEYGITALLHNLGCVALQQQRCVAARDLFTESLELARRTGRKVAIAWCLGGLAGVAAVQAQPTRAARLFAAAGGLLAAIGTQLDPADQAEHDRHLALARAQLAGPGWAAAWASGAALPLDAAVAFATGDEDA